MKKIIVFAVIVCWLAVPVCALADQVKVLSSKPFVYEKIIMVDNEDRQAAKAFGITGGGIAAGLGAGCLMGGPIGCIIGAMAGAYGGASAGAIIAGTTTDKIPKTIKVRGYMVTFDNGQTILTPKKYGTGKKVRVEDIVYDKMI